MPKLFLLRAQDRDRKDDRVDRCKKGRSGWSEEFFQHKNLDFGETLEVGWLGASR